jgi:hypothetical protein
MHMFLYHDGQDKSYGIEAANDAARRAWIMMTQVMLFINS